MTPSEPPLYQKNSATPKVEDHERTTNPLSFPLPLRRLRSISQRLGVSLSRHGTCGTMSISKLL
jgi:hypothetical protein